MSRSTPAAAAAAHQPGGVPAVRHLQLQLRGAMRVCVGSCAVPCVGPCAPMRACVGRARGHAAMRGAMHEAIRKGRARGINGKCIGDAFTGPCAKAYAVTCAQNTRGGVRAKPCWHETHAVDHACPGLCGAVADAMYNQLWKTVHVAGKGQGQPQTQ